METPPREKKSVTMSSKQLHARMKMQMERDMDVEASNPEMERMGEEAPVHTAEVKKLDDDFDDQDLD